MGNQQSSPALVLQLIPNYFHPEMPMYSPEIRLTEQEEALFKKLRNLRDHAGLGNRVVMRVAGGWVRDKLMGIPSKDIDIVPGHPRAGNIR